MRNYSTTQKSVPVGGDRQTAIQGWKNIFEFEAVCLIFTRLSKLHIIMRNFMFQLKPNLTFKRNLIESDFTILDRGGRHI